MQKRQPDARLIVHSGDGGGQYSSIAFRQRLTAAGHRSSMTRRDSHCDNTQAESLFSRFKAELHFGEGRRFKDLAEAETVCFIYLEGYYLTARRHYSLGFRNTGNRPPPSGNTPSLLPVLRGRGSECQDSDLPPV